METATDTVTREAILDGLRRFIGQRSGMDWRNYMADGRDVDGRQAYNADRYAIGRDGRDARRLLEFVAERPSITADDIAARARGGRLELRSDRRVWSYTAGQYFSIEYRAAAARLLAGIIWDYIRDGGNSAEFIRREARGYFGRGIAARYFA
jgi:hypothetical protein